MASPLCEKSSKPGTQVPPVAATTTCAGIELVKKSLLGLYQEQLWSRPEPQGRSSQSFGNILSTAYNACKTRLEHLHNLQDITSFAVKCLREKCWKERFLCEVAEICTSQCIDFKIQYNFVHAVDEAPDFEKSVWETLQVFDYSLHPSTSVIDLEQPEPSAEPSSASSGVFLVPLQGSAEIDLSD